MILQGPSNANVSPPPQPTAQPVVFGITFDMVQHTYTITYGAGQPTRAVSGTIPAGVQTALQNHALRAIEVDQGWAANSASVVTP